MAQPLVAELEGTVMALGAAIRSEHPDWYEARFGELYEGGVAAFGEGGPDPVARLDAELWFLLDCPLDGPLDGPFDGPLDGPFDGGEEPLRRIAPSIRGRVVELLARSELRAWRVDGIEDAGVLGALCPLGTGRARLETARRPLGDLRRGAVLVARSVPVGPGRWVLLGRAPIVDRSALGDFEALLAQLDSPRGEFWRVHGGVLARAAWAWPEDREHTRDGEIVRASLAMFALRDPGAAVAALGGDAELIDLDGADVGGDLRRWGWHWDPPRARSFRLEPGVRYELCAEDAAAVPYLARIVVDAGARDLSLLAPTPARLALAERLLADRLGDALGPLTLREADPPSVVPRWKRAAFERPIVPAARAGRARGAQRAA